MNLTICLVTKGREKYFSSLTKSIEECLLQPDVSLLIIDNGSDELMKEKIQTWAKSCIRTELVRLESNVTSAAEIWLEIFKREIDWAIFPSDDDKIEPKIISEWRDAIQAEPGLVGFATSLSMMDKNGIKTGEIISPACTQNVDVTRVAAAFHEPPFLWPGLFFRVAQLPRELPSSRYVFDWWVGIQLLISGKVETSQSVGVFYRLHEDQESNLVTVRRKYFEAVMCLEQLVNSIEFRLWLSKISLADKFLFWESLVKLPPVYGNTVFSNLLLMSTYKAILESCVLAQEKVEIANRFALHHGVLLRNGQISSILPKDCTMKDTLPGNLNLNVEKDACDEIKRLARFVSSDSGQYSRRLGCMHSNAKENVFKFDCATLVNGSLEKKADQLIKALSLEYEQNELQARIFTSGEMFVLEFLRKIRAIAPKFIHKRLRKLRLKYR